MLTIEEIKKAVKEIAPYYPIRNVLLLGSYAVECATDKSDVDLLVEYEEQPTSLFDVLGFEQQMRDTLKIHVDAIQYPVVNPIDPDFKVNKVITIYEK